MATISKSDFNSNISRNDNDNKEEHEDSVCWLLLLSCPICKGHHPTEKYFKRCKWCGRVHERGEMCGVEKYLIANTFEEPDTIKNLLTSEMKESIQLNWMSDQLKKNN